MILKHYMYHMFNLDQEDIDVHNDNISYIDRRLRSYFKIQIKYNFSSLARVRKSPYYRGVKIWNELPKDDNKGRNKNEFKIVLKNRVKSNNLIVSGCLSCVLD